MMNLREMININLTTPFISVIDYAEPATFNKRYEKALKKRFLNYIY